MERPNVAVSEKISPDQKVQVEKKSWISDFGWVDLQ